MQALYNIDTPLEFERVKLFKIEIWYYSNLAQISNSLQYLDFIENEKSHFNCKFEKKNRVSFKPYLNQCPVVLNLNDFQDFHMSCIIKMNFYV